MKLQAIARDGFAPKLFASSQGRTGEPRWALIATLLLAEAAVLLGDLNQVATLLALFFLVTYGVVNLTCSLETWASNPGFRPGFRIPWLVSAIGALLCMVAMGAINLLAMLFSLVVDHCVPRLITPLPWRSVSDVGIQTHPSANSPAIRR